jgi:hypothetical protein
MASDRARRSRPCRAPQFSAERERLVPGQRAPNAGVQEQRGRDGGDRCDDAEVWAEVRAAGDR